MFNTKFSNCSLLVFSIAVSLNIFICTQVYSQTPGLMWSKTWGGSAARFDIGFSCVCDNQGFLYVTGQTVNSNPADSLDVITIKYNPVTGDTIWARVYNGTNNKSEMCTGSTILSDGSLLVAGFTNAGTAFTDYQMLLIKYNSTSGAIMWEKKFGASTGSPVPQEQGLSCTTDGSNIYVAGTYYESYTSLMLWKLNQSGDTIFTRKFHGPGTGNDMGSGCAVDSAGNIYVGGICNDLAGQKITLLKYNASGVFQWVRYSPDIKNPMFIGTFVTCAVTGSNVIVTGMAGTESNRYGVTFKYSGAGDSIWVKRNDTPSEYDQNNGFSIDSYGDIYIVTGHMEGGDIQINLLKYKGTDGSLIWKVIDSDSVTNVKTGIGCALDNDGFVYLTGMVYLSSTDANTYTAKYQSTIGIRIISSSVPKDYMLSQNYPNPFNPSTVIRFAVPSAADVRMDIFDALGSKVETLFNGKLYAGEYETVWNAANYSSGIYFCRLSSADFTKTIKMILIK